MSDWEKLAELKRLHEQTDYSGMTEAERFKLIFDRFDSCFPVKAISNNLYGPICVDHLWHPGPGGERITPSVPAYHFPWDASPLDGMGVVKV